MVPWKSSEGEIREAALKIVILHYARFIMLTLGFSVLALDKVVACGCAALTKDEGMQDSDLVFLGRVLSATAGNAPEAMDFTRLVVQILLVKKGDISLIPSELRTPNWSGKCGMKVIVPEVYWFFTDALGNFNRCSATRVMLDPELRPWFDESMKAVMHQQYEDARKYLEEQGSVEKQRSE